MKEDLMDNSCPGKTKEDCSLPHNFNIKLLNELISE